MSLVAMGAYLRVYRDDRKLTLDQVGAAVGVTGKQVGNWEHGLHDPKSTFMAALLKTLKAPAEDVAYLLSDPNAKAEDGKRLAYKSLAAERVAKTYLTTREQQAITKERPEDLTPEEKDAIINRMWRLYGELDG